jgi:DNA helicase-2/ATP-dependent DNA helicase PcrA
MQPDQQKLDDAIEAHAIRLNPEQREAATTLSGRLAIISAAGTGKSTTLVRRTAILIDSGAHESDRVLLVTFTNKAAAELRERFADLLGEEKAPKWVTTFHSLGHALLRADPSTAGLEPRFGIADEKTCIDIAKDLLDRGQDDPLLRRITRERVTEIAAEDALVIEDALNDQNVEFKKIRRRVRAELAEAVAMWCSKMKDAGILPFELPDEVQLRTLLTLSADEDVPNPEDLDSVANYNGGLALALRCFNSYQSMLRSRNLADFSDLVLWPARRAVDDDDWRKWIASRWDSVMVDEYQDSSPLQAGFMEALALEHKNIAVVGDDDQCIFEWRNAVPQIIRDFARRDDTKTVVLHRNYRSTAAIIEAANQVIGKNVDRLPKRMTAGLDVPGRPPAVIESEDQWDAARKMAHLAKQAHEKGLPWKKIAVVVRGARSMMTVEQVFAAAGIPLSIVGGLSFFERVDVRNGVSLMKLIQNPSRLEDFIRVINVPSRGLGDTAVDKIRERAEADRINPVEACRRILAEALDISAESIEYAEAGRRFLSEAVINEDASSAEDLFGGGAKKAGGRQGRAGSKATKIVDSAANYWSIDSASAAKRLIEDERGTADFIRHINDPKIGVFARGIRSFLKAYDDSCEYLAPELDINGTASPLQERVINALQAFGLYDAARASKKDKAEGADACRLLDQLGDFIGKAPNFDEGLVMSAIQAGEVDREARTSIDAVELSTGHKAKGREWDLVLMPDWIEGVFPSPMALKEGRLEEERRLAYVMLTRAKRVGAVFAPKTVMGDKGEPKPTQPSQFIAEAGLKVAKLANGQGQNSAPWAKGGKFDRKPPHQQSAHEGGPVPF